MEIENDYRNRVNKVFKYIDDNLDAKLSLEVIAKIAYFSPFHFHRVFKFVTQETLNQYITRRRIEKAASILINKNTRITEIAVECGFQELSSFTRTFKKHYSINPTEFRIQNPNQFSKIRQLNSKNGQTYLEYDKYICIIVNLKNWISMNAKIEVKELTEIKAAAITHIGIKNVEIGFEKLIK